VPNKYSNASAPSWATTTSFVMLCFLKARSVSASSSGLSSTSRIARSVIGCLPVLASQSEVERRPAPHRPLRPHAAAMAVHDALHRGEPHARALELGGRVEALERAEQLVGVRHVESRAVVPDEAGTLPVGLVHAELDARAGVLPGVLPRVTEEVLE